LSVVLSRPGMEQCPSDPRRCAPSTPASFHLSGPHKTNPHP
jgi:hypothetical protein